MNQKNESIIENYCFPFQYFKNILIYIYKYYKNSLLNSIKFIFQFLLYCTVCQNSNIMAYSNYFWCGCSPNRGILKIHSFLCKCTYSLELLIVSYWSSSWYLNWSMYSVTCLRYPTWTISLNNIFINWLIITVRVISYIFICALSTNDF